MSFSNRPRMSKLLFSMLLVVIVQGKKKHKRQRAFKRGAARVEEEPAADRAYFFPSNYTDVYDQNALQFFSHMPATGGTTWSLHLAATYSPEEIAPGSSQKHKYLAERVREAGGQVHHTGVLDPELRSPQSKYRVLYALALPDLPAVLGVSAPHFVTTFLRDPLELWMRRNHMWLMRRTSLVCRHVRAEPGSGDNETAIATMAAAGRALGYLHRERSGNAPPGFIYFRSCGGRASVPRRDTGDGANGVLRPPPFSLMQWVAMLPAIGEPPRSHRIGAEPRRYELAVGCAEPGDEVGRMESQRGHGMRTSQSEVELDVEGCAGLALLPSSDADDDGGGGESEGRSKVGALARAALLRMPWYGVLDHWVGR